MRFDLVSVMPEMFRALTEQGRTSTRITIRRPSLRGVVR